MRHAFHAIPRIAAIDNAPIHKGNAMESKSRQWAAQGSYSDYLPPYNLELNKIEVLRKQAKYFQQRFYSLQGDELLNEANSVVDTFGTKFA